MTKKQKKEKYSVQVWMNHPSRIKFLQYCVNLESVGVIKTKSEIASDLFEVGLNNEFETLDP